MCSSYEDISKQSFELAIKLAIQKLSSMKAEEICRNSGATRIDDDHVLIQYLTRLYQVTISTGDVLLKDKEEEVPVKDQILILHYLTHASGVPFTNKLITYGQIEGGKFYSPVFVQRNLDPILKCFGHRPELLLEVAQKVGAQRSTYGDASVAVDAFPMARIYFIIWKGDDEVPHGGNILFDGNIRHYLASEDVCVLTEILVWKFVNLAKEASST
ncbi:MAG TPA: DUF3786 domain-containing protein [Thermodesulfobacteriota bacterium]|nr:DUF3786 domain-containing protein [Thermodesulfobacteriota bacterium]